MVLMTKLLWNIKAPLITLNIKLRYHRHLTVYINKVPPANNHGSLGENCRMINRGPL